MPFLTDIDSRAAIKGSRDPLGAQAIWTLLGRHVVGGLTTNTTSVRDFVVLLLGHWFIEKLDEAGSREEAPAVLCRWKRRTWDTRLALHSSKSVGRDAERRCDHCRSKVVILPDSRGRREASGTTIPYRHDPEARRAFRAALSLRSSFRVLRVPHLDPEKGSLGMMVVLDDRQEAEHPRPNLEHDGSVRKDSMER